MIERRKESRTCAGGAVWLVMQEPSEIRFDGSLMDVSPRGFRAAHHHAALSAGQELRFEHAGASGRARVMWTRVTAEGVESGFLILGC